MIRLRDAILLAHTKLRVHKVRTGLAVGIAGLLFGVLAAAIMVVQGVFDSVERFGDEGLNDRAIVNVTRSGGMFSFNEYDHLTDAKFVSEVEEAYKQRIADKQAAAKRYDISFNPATDDPSPIVIDPATKQKVISDSTISYRDVQSVVAAKHKAQYKPFDIDKFLAKYNDAHVIQSLEQAQPRDGDLIYMKDGKEKVYDNERERMEAQYNPDTPSLQFIDTSIAKPFISSSAFDATKNEIPVIVPYDKAEKLLGYDKLGKDATTEERLSRMNEVRRRIGEVSTSFCYRNRASQNLLGRAESQQQELKRFANDKNYIKPSLIYKVPGDGECGAVTIESDKRTAAERKQDDNRKLFEQAIGEYVGDPIERKITVRGVGISGSVDMSSQAWSVSDIVTSLFNSNLGYSGAWSIPEDMFEQLPDAAALATILGRDKDQKYDAGITYMYESYLVEFTNKDNARDMLNETNNSRSNEWAMVFGSGVLVVDEMKQWVASAMGWVFLVIGTVAMIILAGIVGRSVADGRRESAVFRAIGASRGDIGAIYGAYTLLLCTRIVVFAGVMGGVLALIIELLFWRDATLGARLAYAASETTKEFHMIGLGSPYLLWLIGVIFAAGILAAIIPILLGARRNPIGDMRNDT